MITAANATQRIRRHLTQAGLADVKSVASTARFGGVTTMVERTNRQSRTDLNRLRDSVLKLEEVAEACVAGNLIIIRWHR